MTEATLKLCTPGYDYTFPGAKYVIEKPIK